jgi:hypothetical protein
MDSFDIVYLCGTTFIGLLAIGVLYFLVTGTREILAFKVLSITPFWMLNWYLSALVHDSDASLYFTWSITA